MCGFKEIYLVLNYYYKYTCRYNIYKYVYLSGSYMKMEFFFPFQNHTLLILIFHIVYCRPETFKTLKVQMTWPQLACYDEWRQSNNDSCWTMAYTRIKNNMINIFIFNFLKEKMASTTNIIRLVYILKLCELH